VADVGTDVPDPEPNVKSDGPKLMPLVPSLPRAFSDNLNVVDSPCAMVDGCARHVAATVRFELLRSTVSPNAS
jgi:hypothetical protein